METPNFTIVVPLAGDILFMGRILSIWGFPSVSSYIFMFIDLNDVKSNIDMSLLFELIQVQRLKFVAYSEEKTHSSHL